MNSSMKNLVHRFRSRRGMASALIIMLLVLLVFFAVLTLVTSAADLRLSQKRASWNQNYYEADGAALAFVADLQQQLDLLDADTSDSAMLETYLESFDQLIEWSTYLDTESSGGQPAEATRVLDAIYYCDSNCGQGISFRLHIQPNSSSNSIEIVRWEQWQPDFDYGGDSGGLWKG